ncbi:MAG: YihA family ribosome biogenesis GTP-binding protein [Deltaproteobacteria bacterium]|nr:MAG: YihA family ribosome biogenesis GTP-binding protein [Deltaproteobacteria bacterium]
MIIRSARFVCSAVAQEQYPAAGLPEVAFAGRSNVGKSSLINKLLNRKNLVRTSKAPGRTQLLNFFEINGKWHFVDLPGYGYAKVPVEVRKSWRPMVENYLLGRVTMRGIVFLLDIRRTPSKEDLTFWSWQKSKGLAVITVLTKVDKLSRGHRKKQVASIAQGLECEPDTLLQFSAKSGEGREALWRRLLLLLEADH